MPVADPERSAATIAPVFSLHAIAMVLDHTLLFRHRVSRSAIRKLGGSRDR